MAPNLFVAARTLVTPTEWLPRRQKQRTDSITVPGQPLARTEHWKSPVPGVYRYKLGGGWCLIQLDSDPSKPERPERVIYCAPLNRSILESDYNARTMQAKLPKGCTPAASRSPSPTRKQSVVSIASTRRGSKEDMPQPVVNFVRHEDGVSWLNDRDAEGKPTKGPWQRFCIDKKTGEMRVMLKGDDPAHKQKSITPISRPSSIKSGDSSSVASKIKAIAPELDQQAPHTPSFLGPTSLAGSARTSRRNSLDSSRPASIRMPSDKSVRMVSLSSPGIAT